MDGRCLHERNLAIGAYLQHAREHCKLPASSRLCLGLRGERQQQYQLHMLACCSNSTQPLRVYIIVPGDLHCILLLACRPAWLDQAVQPNAAMVCFKRVQDWRELGQQLGEYSRVVAAVGAGWRGIGRCMQPLLARLLWPSLPSTKGGVLRLFSDTRPRSSNWDPPPHPPTPQPPEYRAGQPVSVCNYAYIA
jgi:hypothetical protein